MSASIAPRTRDLQCPCYPALSNTLSVKQGGKHPTVRARPDTLLALDNHEIPKLVDV